MHYLDIDLETEMHKDGVWREVLHYDDGTDNVGYAQAGDTIDLRGETKLATTGAYVDRYSQDVRHAAPVRLQSEYVDAAGATRKTHYYVSSEYNLMLVDDDPDDHTVPLKDKPMRPIRFDADNLKVTIGEPLWLQGIDGVVGYDGKVLGGQSGKKTRPVKSAMLLASYLEPYKLGWQSATAIKLPAGDVRHRKLAGHNNPLAEIGNKFVEEDRKLKHAGH